jgi:Spy/CpxP family protein refolding chaperone
LTAATVAGLAAGMVFAEMPARQAATAPEHNQMDSPRGNRMKANREVRWKLMTGYLDLTAPQQTKVKAIFSNAREEARPLHKQLREVRAELRAAIRENKPVKELSAKEGNVLGQLAGIRANSAEQFRALLTPQQLQKLQELHARNGAWRAPRMSQKG